MNLRNAIAGLMFNPRGRMSRQDLLVAAIIMLALDMGLASSLEGFALYGLKALAYWIGGVGIIKRLHDVGKSGWWLLWGALFLCMWSAVVGLAVVFTVGLEALNTGSPGYIVLFAALMLPALGATLWLHLAEGEPGMNRFGPVPAGILAAFGDGRGHSAADQRS